MKAISRSNGAILSDEITHIEQSISDILTTPIGSRVMRREYGSLISDLVDTPLSPAAILRLYAAVASAVMRWEPRFKITQISIEFKPPAGAYIKLNGTINGSAYTINTGLKG